MTSRYEEERLRAAEQSQIVYLQGQIDEIRRLLKDQTNKYNWAMEQMRKVESNIVQIEGLFERHSQETSHQLESYRRDINVLRKEIAAALVRVDESNKPIREMQTQIHQLGEARKQDRDQIAGWLLRIEELEQRTLSWNAQLRENEERYRSLFAQLEGFTSADEALRAEIRKSSEELQIEKQGLRRQSVEAQQLVADVRSILDNHNSRLARLDEIRQHIELFADQVPGQISELADKFNQLVGEIKRIERVSTERFLMNQERLEEVRQQQDEKVVLLQETDEQHLQQLTAWLERLDGWVRQLEQQQSRAVSRLEVLQREQSAQLSELEQHDFQLLDVLVATLTKQLERLKAEQIERGKDQGKTTG